MATSGVLESAPRLTRFIFPVLRILFGAVFLSSGALKLLNLNQFQSTVANFDILPVSYLPFVAFAIPSLEIILGIAIMFDMYRTLTYGTVLAMLGVFTSILVVALATGSQVSCGCFGDLSTEPVSGLTIVRNIGLILWGITLATYYEAKRVKIKISPEPGGDRRIGSPGEAIYRVLGRGFLFCFVGFLLVVSMTLAIQNRSLKERILLITSDRSSLKAGDLAQPIEGWSTSGSFVKIDFENVNRAFVFVMKGSCKPCKENLPVWRTIAASLRKSDVKVLGVSVDSLELVRRYVAENAIGFEMLSIPDRSFISRYKIVATP